VSTEHPAPTSGVLRVSVFSTGRVRIRPEHVGPTWKHMYVWLLTSRRWTAPRPVNVYVVEHRDGVVVFDTGQDRASVTDPSYFPRGIVGRLYARLAQFRIGPEDTVTAGLAALGLTPQDVRTVVLSHLHEDHIGGLGELAPVEVMVGEAEWRWLQKPLPEVRGLLRTHIELPGLRWTRPAMRPLPDADLAPFPSGHDLFGDGTVLLLPTPGHTPGSLSMLVRREGAAPLLLVGDLTYDDDLLRAEALPGVGSRRRLRESTRLVNALRSRLPGLVVLPAHDPGAADRLAASAH
jgi:N-acyl homoserine lactone hydrolase